MQKQNKQTNKQKRFFTITEPAEMDTHFFKNWNAILDHSVLLPWIQTSLSQKPDIVL